MEAALKEQPGLNAGQLALVARPPKQPKVTVSARVDAGIKRHAQEIIEKKGLTLSEVFQQTLEQIARTGEVTCAEPPRKFTPEEIRRKLEIFKRCTLPEPYNITDKEIKEMRLREKYGIEFDD